MEKTSLVGKKKRKIYRLSHNLGYDGNLRSERIKIERAREFAIVVYAALRKYAAK